MAFSPRKNVYRVQLVDSRKKSILERSEERRELSKPFGPFLPCEMSRSDGGLSGMRFETVVSRRTIEMICSFEATRVAIRGESASLRIFPTFEQLVIHFSLLHERQYIFVYPTETMSL